MQVYVVLSLTGRILTILISSFSKSVKSLIKVFRKSLQGL